MIDRMRSELSGIPGMAFSFSQPIQCRIDELVAGTRAQLIIKLFGENMEVLKTKADEIGQVVGRIRGTADLVVERIAGQPYLTIDIDRNKIARHGLNVSDVQKVIEIAVGGKAATQLYEENRSFDVTVRYPVEYRNSVETISNTLVATRHGYNVPLNQLAEISVVEGPVQVSREDGLRRIGIEINIQDRDIGSYVAEAKEVDPEEGVVAGGVLYHMGGQFENQQRAMNRLMIIGPIAIGLILLLLFVTFRSIAPGAPRPHESSVRAHRRGVRALPLGPLSVGPGIGGIYRPLRRGGAQWRRACFAHLPAAAGGDPGEGGGDPGES